MHYAGFCKVWLITFENRQALCVLFYFCLYFTYIFLILEKRGNNDNVILSDKHTGRTTHVWRVLWGVRENSMTRDRSTRRDGHNIFIVRIRIFRNDGPALSSNNIVVLVIFSYLLFVTLDVIVGNLVAAKRSFKLWQ